MTLTNKQLILVAVRLKSSRLKKKAILDIFGKPLIIRLFERLNENIPRENIVICTSTNSQDDALCDLVKNHSINLFRGSELDVAHRFISAAKQRDADTIVRVTGDNPLTDPEFIKKMLLSHDENNAEYTYTNDLPIGARAEVISVEALRRIRKQWSDPNSSEYMTFMVNRGDTVRQNRIVFKDKGICRPELRLTVDTKEDLEMIRAIYKHFSGNVPNLEQIIEYLDKKPEIRINEDLSKVVSLHHSIDCSYLDD